MGDAADELWDAGFQAQADFDMMVQSIRQSCGAGKGTCEIVSNSGLRGQAARLGSLLAQRLNGEDREEDLAQADMPYRCVTCGRTFDF